MLLRRTYRSVNPSVRRRELARELVEIIIYPCDYCIRGHKQYLIGADSDRYSNYVESSRKYDLVVSP